MRPASHAIARPTAAGSPKERPDCHHPLIAQRSKQILAVFFLFPGPGKVALVRRKASQTGHGHGQHSLAALLLADAFCLLKMCARLLMVSFVALGKAEMRFND